MSWHDPQPPVLPYWPTLGLLLLTILLGTGGVYLLFG